MTRGPKLRTADNAAPGLQGFIRHESLDPPSPLSGVAATEYWRLLGVLMDKGILDRIDLATVCECARIKAALDALYERDPDLAARGSASQASLLTVQRRGLLRELSLTLQPSRSVVRTNPVATEDDPIAKLVKLSG